MRFWIDMVWFARKNDWDMFGWVFGEMWTWAEQNAMRSHDERPWGSWNRSRMMNALHPDEFWF